MSRPASKLSVLRCMAAFLAAVLCLPGVAAASPFAVSTVAQLERPLETGEYFWDDEGVPRGRMAIVVDLYAERMYVYRGGVEIARSSIVQGWGRHATPTGTFSILQKNADHYSNLYDNAPMPYMLRLTWGGVAIHGSEVADDAATHGCIGIPEEFARILFYRVRKGDKVLVTRRWLTREYY